MISPELREYAENPDRFSYVVEGAGVTRFADERVCIVQGTTWASVSGIRVAPDEVDALVEDVRSRVPTEKWTLWWVGPSTRPPDLASRVRALGLGPPRDRASLLHAMVLTHEPAVAPRDVEVVRIDTFERFVAAREVQWEAFGTPEERRENQRQHFEQEFADAMRFGVPVGFLATVDGRPAGTALAVPSDRGAFLIGGCVAEWARGRGLYRALVRARWDYAMERGTPALVTHAMPDTSYPILQRLGFEEVCEIRRLEDPRDLAQELSQDDERRRHADGEADHQ